MAPNLALTLLLVHATLARPAPSFHVLLDVSTTMASQNRIYKARAALQHWISSQVPNGSELGLWQFTRQPEEVRTAIIADVESRKTMVNLIPEKAGGQSCIFCAISSTLKKLKENSTLIVITDGEDNNLDDVVYVSAETQNISKYILLSNIQIAIILIGKTFSNNIGMLSDVHNGYMYHADDDDVIPSLIQGLQQLTQLTTNCYPTPITVFEKEVSSAEQQVSAQWTVDPLLRRASPVCVYIYYWPRSMTIHGNISTPNDAFFPLDLQDGHFKFCELHEKEGRWTANLHAEEFNKFVAILVTARSKERDLHGTFVCWFDKTRKLFSLHASFHSENDTTLRCDPSAEVQSLTGLGLYRLKLWDNGMGADAIAGDQIFSRYTSPQVDPGLYVAKCECAVEINEVNSVHAVSAFSRYATTSMIRVDGVSKTYPPSPIKDLRACSTGRTSLSFHFTATGNELDTGKALLYTLIIRSENNYDSPPFLVKNLTNAPHMVGSEEVITCNSSSLYSETFDKFCVSICVISTTGLLSEESNIVEVVLNLKEAERITNASNQAANTNTENAYETTTVKTIGTGDAEQETSYFYLVYIFLALAAAVVLILCIIAYYVTKMNSGKYRFNADTADNINLKKIDPNAQYFQKMITYTNRFEAKPSTHEMSVIIL